MDPKKEYASLLAGSNVAELLKDRFPQIRALHSLDALCDVELVAFPNVDPGLMMLNYRAVAASSDHYPFRGVSLYKGGGAIKKRNVRKVEHKNRGQPDEHVYIRLNFEATVFLYLDVYPPKKT